MSKTSEEAALLKQILAELQQTNKLLCGILSVNRNSAAHIKESGKITSKHAAQNISVRRISDYKSKDLEGLTIDYSSQGSSRRRFSTHDSETKLNSYVKQYNDYRENVKKH